MKALALVFTAYSCPGLVSWLPAVAKPALALVGVCKAKPAVELYDPARAAAARARVRALGAPAQLYPVDGLRIGDALVDWQLVASIKENTP